MALTKVSRGLLTTSIVDNGNATAITIDASENVGIGTSSPSAPLNISATYASDTTEQFRIQDNTGSKLDFFGYANGSKGIQAYADNGSTFYNLNLNPLGGNVGIGIAPSVKLEVNGGADGSVVFSGRSDGGNGNNQRFNLIAFADGGGSGYGGGLKIQTRSSANVFSDSITVTSAGNVGIGTSTPYNSAKLDVLGSVISTSQTIATYAANNAGFDFAAATKVGRFFTTSTDATGGHMTFITGAGGGIERMRIDSSGRVTMPYQPAFQAVSVTQENIPINGSTTVNFGGQIFDQGSNYAGTTFTAPVTGKYQLNVILYAQSVDSAADYVQIALVTSNRSYYAIFSTNSLTQDAAYMTFPITVLADMDASDTAYVEVQLNNTGSSQMDINANGSFSGYLVA